MNETNKYSNTREIETLKSTNIRDDSHCNVGWCI